MKVPVNPNVPVNIDELRSSLQQRFPDHKVFMRGKSIIVVQKSGAIGTTVLVGRKALIVNGNFPTMGGQLLFVLSLLLFGFLIPLIVYFAAFHGKMKAVEKEVGAFLTQKFPAASAAVA